MEKRLITLFTGQWADIPAADLFPLVKRMGYDGVELACWGDHFNVRKALEDDSYIPQLKSSLEQHGLVCHAISNHLVGQAVCDLIDGRHKEILPPHVWGDGEAEGVRQRAAEEMKLTAQAAAKFGVGVVNGFTGSSIWHSIYAFPPTSQAYWDQGFEDFAVRWKDIMNTFEANDIKFALEVHPTEIAFDIASAQRAIAALEKHNAAKNFGFNYDPSHLGYQGVDYVKFLYQFSNKIFHAHMKDVWWNKGDGSVGVFGGHTDFTDARRFWDFRSVGRGDINFERIIVALNDIGYDGPLSVEWEDGRMEREFGAEESANFLRKLDFRPSGQAFDSAFSKK